MEEWRMRSDWAARGSSGDGQGEVASSEQRNSGLEGLAEGIDAAGLDQPGRLHRLGGGLTVVGALLVVGAPWGGPPVAAHGIHRLGLGGTGLCHHGARGHAGGEARRESGLHEMAPRDVIVSLHLGGLVRLNSMAALRVMLTEELPKPSGLHRLSLPLED